MEYYSVDPSYGIADINEIEVDKTTDKCVVMGGRRVAKNGGGRCYIPTYKEAVMLVETHLNNKLILAAERIRNAKELIKKTTAELKEVRRILEDETLTTAKQ